MRRVKVSMEKEDVKYDFCENFVEFDLLENDKTGTKEDFAAMNPLENGVIFEIEEASE